WLDAALLGGTVHDAHAVVSGDLDDWPFIDHDGLFQADARISDATLKFQPDWPAAQHVDGDVSFVADGFTVSGKGTIAGVGIRHFDAGIPHFGKAELTVKAQGGGDAAQLLGLLRQSPLQKQYAETLDHLGASGLAAVTFDLDLPLYKDGGRSKLGGTVTLAGVKLSEQRWKLAFDDVRGRAEYGHGGFVADKLAVTRAGQPGKLSLRAGDYTRDPKQAFEAELDAMLSAKDLLDRAPELDWLKPRVEGRSPWTIAVSIPKSANAKVVAPTRLQLRSSLVGTALTLPAPLDKPAGVALDTTVETNLPFDQGEIAVAFGDRLALRARSRNGQTGLRVELGSRQVDEAPPASGLIATGRTASLDAIDWAALTRGGGSGSGGGLSLRRVDVTAARLRLLGTDFANTRVRATPSAAGTALQFDGDALAGAVLLPQADNAAIAGRLQRMYWQVGKPVVTPAQATMQRDDDVDPAKVPPLNLVVDDLRFGDAHLGAASLRTHPLANGMRIEQLQSRASKQRIDVSGEWLGRGGAARTRLAMQIDSDDFGGLLAGFGYGGQLSGGKGTAHFDAEWPGSPAGFSLGGVDGTLKLSARDGQLTEVEPGAGRVLGLLSLAQLPRRLTLDFRDFFSKGFAFNKLDGDVHLDSGTARTDSLVIDGPAAEIHISGAADLRTQTFDQTIEVLPKAGNLLTAVGAIAGGPIGAAIGAAANAVLRKPLGQLGAKTYRVTGPWKEPKVEVIGREQSRIPAPRDPAPAG
ncbi:MAG: YhdP family protein, partial [Luteimonas sp.]